MPAYRVEARGVVCRLAAAADDVGFAIIHVSRILYLVSLQWPINTPANHMIYVRHEPMFIAAHVIATFADASIVYANRALFILDLESY